LWGGSVHDYVNPSARERLARLRELIFAGRVGARFADAADIAGEERHIGICLDEFRNEGLVAQFCQRYVREPEERVAAPAQDAELLAQQWPAILAGGGKTR